MRRFLLYISLLLSIVANGQRPAAMMVGTSFTPVYVPIPDAPTFTSPSTRTFGSGGTFINAFYGANGETYISGDNWTTMTYSGVTGTAGEHKRMRNLDANTIVGGISPANYGIATFSNSNFYDLYGYNSTAPFRISQCNGCTADPQNALQFSAIAAKTTFIAQNIVIDSINASGAFFNSSATLSGGDASTIPSSSVTYDSTTVSFTRVFEAGQEGYYVGNTSKTAYAINEYSRFTHGLTYSTVREGLQFNNHLDLQLSNFTVKDAGTGNVGTQRALGQFQNTVAVIENVIFDSAPDFIDIASMNIVFRNCYFKWDTNIAGYIHDYYTSYNSSSRLMVTPVQILFENCIFDPSVTVTYAFDVNDNITDIEWRGCIFSTNITNLYDDNRSAPTGTITGTLSTNGNVQWSPAEIPDVTYTNFDPEDYENHGLVTSSYYFKRGMGFRTPPN